MPRLTGIVVCALAIPLAAQIPPVTFPPAAAGVPYYFSFGELAGQEADPETGYTLRFSISPGSSLPPGLSLRPDGLLSGTPTVADDFRFVLAVEPVTGGITRSAAVFLKIREAAGPPLEVSPASGVFLLYRGGARQSRLVTIANEGRAPQSFLVRTATDSGGNWLTVSESGGTVSAFNDTTILVTADPQALPAGTYTGQVTITTLPVVQSLQVSVTATVSDAPQSIRLSQSGLRFVIEEGDSPPPAQTLYLLGDRPGSLDFSVTAPARPGRGGLLTVAPTAGRAAEGIAAAVKVNLNPAALAPGDYYGTVQVSSPGADNSPQTASVVLNVLPAGSRRELHVEPTGLIFAARAGGSNPPPRMVTLTNPSNLPVRAKAGVFLQDGGNWLAITPATGVVTAARPLEVTVHANTAGLAPGVYRGDLAVGADAGPIRRVAVLLVVLPAAASPDAAGARTANGCTPTKLLPVFTHLSPGFSSPAGWPVPLTVAVVDDCGDPMRTGNVQAVFSNGDPPLSLLSLNDGTWSATWLPRTPAEQVSIVVRAEQSSPRLEGREVTGGQVTTTPPVPVISPGGAVSAASYAPRQPLAPGSFISVFGERLSSGLTVSPTIPYATHLGPTSAVLGGRELPLQFAGDGQVNAIVPFDVPPNSVQQLIVVNGDALSAPEPVVIAAAQPAVFTQNLQGTGSAIVVAVTQDGRQFLVDAAHPAHTGDALVIYCAGLGAVNPPVAAGSAAPGFPLSRTTNPVTVTVGGIPAEVFFAGLAPGFPSIYQVNAFVPSGVPSGPEVPLTIAVAGQQGVSVSVAIE